MLHAKTRLVDRVDLVTPLALSSQPATGLSALAPAQRAGAQRLRAMCRFSAAAMKVSPRTQRAAAEKRQGTKSREIGHRPSSGRDEDSMLSGKPKIVRWASRQAGEVQQWTASELIDRYFEGRRPGRTLPQLPRFGMGIAQEYF